LVRERKDGWAQYHAQEGGHQHATGHGSDASPRAEPGCLSQQNTVPADRGCAECAENYQDERWGKRADERHQQGHRTREAPDNGKHEETSTRAVGDYAPENTADGSRSLHRRDRRASFYRPPAELLDEHDDDEGDERQLDR